MNKNKTKLSWEYHTRNPSWVGQIKMFFRLVEKKMSKCWDPSLPNLGGRWVGGWGVLTGSNTTSWLHLASWNLPDFQLSWKSKMELSVAKIGFGNNFWKWPFLRLKETIEPFRPHQNTFETHSRHTLTFPKRSRFKKGLSAKIMMGGDRHNRWGRT